MAMGTAKADTRTVTAEETMQWATGKKPEIGARIMAVLHRLKHSEKTLIGRQGRETIGVLTADWEYLTSVAAPLQMESWNRVIRGEKRGDDPSKD